MAQIIAQRFPIAGPLGGHLYLAIVDNGELITDLHGLAFNPKTGQIKEFGSEDDFILAFRDPPPPNNLYDAEHAQIVLLDGTTADLLTIVDDYLTPMMEYINSYQFSVSRQV